MSTPSLYVIDLKMTSVNIIVIFVKKNEIQDIGFTTVKIVVILLTLNVFLENTQITSLEVFTHLIATHTLLLSLRKLKLMMTHHDIYVIVLINILFINVSNVNLKCANFVHWKGKCSFKFYFILDLVHRNSDVWNSSNDIVVIIFNSLCSKHGSYRTWIHCIDLCLSVSSWALPCSHLLGTRNL